MRSTTWLPLAVLLVAPSLALAASAPTQSRSGLGSASHPTQPTGSLPSGSENASTGPQAHPAYPSTSTTANPGAAFVRTKPKPATGALASPPGVISSTSTGRSGRTTHPTTRTVGTEPAGKAVGQ